jgi:hypothetical protein
VAEMIKELMTVKSINPKYQNWLIIATREGRVFFIPEKEFLDLMVEAQRRFKTIAPLAPYPYVLGALWKTNSTLYKWFIKRLEEKQEVYRKYIDEYRSSTCSS